MSSPPSPSKLRDLALALTEEERRDLLKRINSALSLKQSADPQVSPHALSREKRLELMREEIAGLSFFDRLVFWFKRLLSTKGDEDTFIAFKLGRLRRRLRAAGLTVVMPATISERVAQVVWDLYKAAYGLIPVFLDLWRGGTYLQDSVEYLLSMRIPGARKNLYDFVALEELQERYLETERKQEVRDLVLTRLDEYLADVPDDIFDHLGEGVMPLYMLRGVCLFDYNYFFDVFGFDPGVVPPEETPPFRESPTSAAIGPIEELYSSLHSASKLPKDSFVHSELLDRYLEIKESETEPEAAAATVAADLDLLADKGGSDPAASGEESEPDPQNQREEDAYQKRHETVDQLKSLLRDLGQQVRRTSSRIPFVELVRYYRSDPYYKLRSNVPRINLREFYSSYLTMRLLSQVDRGFKEIRRGVVSRLTKQLFGRELQPFEFYRPGIQPATNRMGLPAFQHMRSLNVLYNFLRLIYHGHMQETVRILSRILPIRQRDASSGLVVHVAGLEDVHDHIRAFDYSFSPDSDDGKAFLRIRFAVEKDVTQHRTYRNIVTAKDREARQLLDRGMEHVTGLERSFSEIQRSLTDQLRERYAAADSLVSRLDGLDHLLERNLEKIATFNRLIKQVIAGEEGY